MTVTFYQDNQKQWRWRILSKNGRIIADSAEGYVNKADAEAGFELVANMIIKEK